MYLVLGRQNCPYCDKAKELLESKGEDYRYVDITSGEGSTDKVWKDFLVTTLGVKTVPQVFKLLPGGYEGLLQEVTE